MFFNSTFFPQFCCIIHCQAATLFVTVGGKTVLCGNNGGFSRKQRQCEFVMTVYSCFFISLLKPLMWGAKETDRDVYAGKRRTVTVLFFLFFWLRRQDVLVLINSPIIAERSYRQPCEEQQFGPIILGFVICRFWLIWRAPVHYFLNRKFQIMIHSD